MSGQDKVVLWFLLFLASWTFFGQQFTPFAESYNRLVQGVSFSEDGNSLFMALPHKERMEALHEAIENSPPLAIYKTHRIANGGWAKPELLSFSGKYKDYEPTTSPDGHWLFFNSNRPTHGDVAHMKNNIWFVEKTLDGWSTPETLEKINHIDLEVSYPTISKDKKLIYSREVVTDNESEYHLYETQFDGVSTMPGNKITLPDFDKQSSDPWIAANGSYLIFTGFDLPEWEKTCDLYISFHKNGNWTEPMLMEELNSAGPDFAVAVSHDEQWIYYRQNYEYKKMPFQDYLIKMALTKN